MGVTCPAVCKVSQKLGSPVVLRCWPVSHDTSHRVSCPKHS
uniref:Uncharacterized protein n=1 Tax=Anguilla anguilla TaxID=7936 RepID=A0A0E9XP95_ANGAN